MQETKVTRNDIFICIFIGISFLWTGASYMTWWLYKLTTTFSNVQSDILSEGVGYLFQVLGIIIFSLLMKKHTTLHNHKAVLPILVVGDYIFSLMAFLCNAPSMILLFGFLMNLFHGLLAAFYLTKLSLYASKRHTGVVFGLGYAIGSVGTYILSSLLPGSLGTPWIFAFYAVLAIVVYFINNMIDTNTPEDAPIFTAPQFGKREIILAGIIVLLLSFVKNIGFYFPTSDVITGAVDPVFVRCFYAIGLIIAGIINDKSRRYGSVCCICALVFPFLILTLNSTLTLGVVVWLMGYVFFGFFSVYRVVIFSDISRSSSKYLYLACLGLMFGRIGDATSAMLGVSISSHTQALILLSALLFVGTIFVFFYFYNLVYVKVIPSQRTQEDIFLDFLAEYQISQRETEVLRKLLSGSTNSEIAESLYISESTVKFHVRNILKKTDCSNRGELMKLYQHK